MLVRPVLNDELPNNAVDRVALPIKTRLNTAVLARDARDEGHVRVGLYL